MNNKNLNNWRNKQQILMSTHITSYSISQINQQNSFNNAHYNSVHNFNTLLSYIIKPNKMHAFQSIKIFAKNKGNYKKQQQIKNKQQLQIKQKQQQLRQYASMGKQMFMFLNHCAELIQSRFKGYQLRKYYKIFRPVFRRFKQLLLAVFYGWKVRKILRFKHIRNKINKIKQKTMQSNSKSNNNINDNTNNMNNQAMNNNNKYLREARILKRELMQELEYMLKKGRWLQNYRQEKKMYEKQKQKIKISKIILKSVSNKNKGLQQKQNTKKSKISNKFCLDTNNTNKSSNDNNFNQTQRISVLSHFNKSRQSQTNNRNENNQTKNIQTLNTNRTHKQLLQAQQKPIKATGYYNIQDIPIKSNQQPRAKDKNINRNLKSKLKVSDKTKKQDSKNKSKDNKQEQKIDKKDNIQKGTQIKQKKQGQTEKIQKSSITEANKSISSLSILLPVQQIQCEQVNQNRNVQNKTMKIHMSKMLERNNSSDQNMFINNVLITNSNANLLSIKLDLNNNNSLSNSKKQMFQTQKLRKSQRKGIKVTLSSSGIVQTVKKNELNRKQLEFSLQNPANKIKTGYMTPISNIDLKTNPNTNIIANKPINVSKKINSESTKKEAEQKKEEHDQLSQILQVYNGTYSRKKYEITMKLQEMKTKMKFINIK